MDIFKEWVVELKDLVAKELILPVSDEYGRKVWLPLKGNKQRQTRLDLDVVSYIEASDSIGWAAQTDQIFLGQAQYVVGRVVGKCVEEMGEAVGYKPLLHVLVGAVTCQTGCECCQRKVVILVIRHFKAKCRNK
jgi:hypothetical protein